MCLGCAKNYGPEVVIVKELRTRFGYGEAAQLPRTQSEWNELYPLLQEAIEKHYKEAKRGWDDMLREEAYGK